MRINISTVSFICSILTASCVSLMIVSTDAFASDKEIINDFSSFINTAKVSNQKSYTLYEWTSVLIDELIASEKSRYELLNRSYKLLTSKHMTQAIKDDAEKRFSKYSKKDFISREKEIRGYTGKWLRFVPEIAGIEYDISRTNSLVKPYIGYITGLGRRTYTELVATKNKVLITPISRFDGWYKFMMTYEYKNSVWKLKNIKYKIEQSEEQLNDLWNSGDPIKKESSFYIIGISRNSWVR